MVTPGRRKSIALFIALGIGLISVILLLYVGWVLLAWKTGFLLVIGVLLLAMLIAGVVLNTIFLVREIRRNEQHDAFINAVTHELKTPVASIRLYLETLQSRNVDEARRREFYRVMLEDSDRLLGTIEQVLRTGRMGSAGNLLHSVPIRLEPLLNECVSRARTLHNLPEEAIRYSCDESVTVLGELDEIRAAIANLIDNAIKYSGTDVRIEVTTDKPQG